MLLRNFDFAVKYFDYNSKIELENTLNPKINGWYKFINGLLSGLLVVNNNLYFLHGENKFLITESNRVSIKGKGDFENEFSLLNGNDVFVRFVYSIPNAKLSTSPFEYIDEDDFKWGEFIEKIMNNEDRKRSFVLNIMESLN